MMAVRDEKRWSLITSNLLLVLCLNLVCGSLHICDVHRIAPTQGRALLLPDLSDRAAQSSFPLQPCLACSYQKHRAFVFTSLGALLDPLRIEQLVHDLTPLPQFEHDLGPGLSRAPPFL